MTSLLLLLAAAAVPAAAGWEFLYEKEGIKVYRMHVEGSSVVAFKGEAELDAGPARVAGVLSDVPRKLEWVHAIREVRLVRQAGPLELVEYNRTHLPWPFSDRDFVFHAKAAVDKARGMVEFRLQSVDDPSEPPKPGLVRASLNEGLYLLQPLSGGARTRLTVQIHADPQGYVPKWLINLFQKKWPLRTISGIRRQLAKADVAEHREIAELLAGR